MEATACCRTVDQVTHLVQGPDLFICDICVDACVNRIGLAMSEALPLYPS
jgi:ATP-dependent protease Clp ATPase subunit